MLAFAAPDLENRAVACEDPAGLPQDNTEGLRASNTCLLTCVCLRLDLLSPADKQERSGEGSAAKRSSFGVPCCAHPSSSSQGAQG